MADYHERLKDRMRPYLNHLHDSTVAIKEIDGPVGNQDELRYSVKVEYFSPEGIREATHSVLFVTGNNAPHSIDGKTTREGAQAEEDSVDLALMMSEGLNS